MPLETPRAAALVSLWPKLDSQLLPGLQLEVLQEVDSTNSELMRRARAGRFNPTLLVAEQQTAGRGRLGRQWDSGGPQALTFSLGLVLDPQDWSGLSLAVGLAVAQSLHPDLRLKWPNDIWLNDRKLAGILIETASFDDTRYVVIGIGINIEPRPADGLSAAPACLQDVLSGIDAQAALQQLAEPLLSTVKRFEQVGFAPFQSGFNALDVLAGRAVVLSDGQTGTARGVDAKGALLLQTQAGVKKITSAEVSVRPVLVPPVGSP
jgi:BirA family transcriptional regulator, biotin operon repressor / biotin---[acetyl-CoA-carboxylase] ligase